MTSLYIILIAAGIMLLLAVVLSWILGWANVTFAVTVDPREEAVLNVLPGANCGACGFAGCADMAKSLVDGKSQATQCTQCSAAQVGLIAEILGVEAGTVVPCRAVVHCSATCLDRKDVQKYEGEPTCAAANLLTGIQGCAYGCLGQGDCMRACNYGAIHIENGLARIDYSKCVGCKACEAVCPRRVIRVLPFEREQMYVIACSNLDAGPEVKSVCPVGCIGCGGCARRSPQTFKMRDGLPVMDYTDYDPEALTEAVEKCPVKIIRLVGQGSGADDGSQKRQ